MGKDEEPIGPPPSYGETFPERVPNSTETLSSAGDSSNNEDEVLRKADDTLKSVTKIDIVAIHGEEGDRMTRKLKVTDHENGRELFQVLEVPRTGDLWGSRKIAVTFPDSNLNLLQCRYMTTSPFFLHIMSSNGSLIGVFQKDHFHLGCLCPCLCLCWCFPMATASIKNQEAEKVLIADAHLFPRIVSIKRPSSSMLFGGSTVARIDLGVMLSENIANLTLEDIASSKEKILSLGLAVGMMDYEMQEVGRHYMRSQP